jgi:RNA polymerase sigma factor (sigma-70 family)
MDTSRNPTPIHTALENRERTDELRRFIRSCLFRRGAHHRGIEDETHEIFQRVSVRALQKASTFNPNCGDVGVWFNRIADRIIIDEYRKKQKSRVIFREIVEEPSTVGDPIQELFAASGPKVREVLALLSMKYQEVFKFSYEEGMKGEELARALGCSTPAAARVLVFRFRDGFTVGWTKIVFRRADACEYA